MFINIDCCKGSASPTHIKVVKETTNLPKWLLAALLIEHKFCANSMFYNYTVACHRVGSPVSSLGASWLKTDNFKRPNPFIRDCLIPDQIPCLMVDCVNNRCWSGLQQYNRQNRFFSFIVYDLICTPSWLVVWKWLKHLRVLLSFQVHASQNHSTRNNWSRMSRAVIVRFLWKKDDRSKYRYWIVTIEAIWNVLMLLGWNEIKHGRVRRTQSASFA